MEFEYNGVSSIGKFQELKLATCFRGEEYGISSVAFDLQEDLLWAATYGGHVTSFYSSSLDKYTCFQAHHEDIRHLQPTLGGVVSMTEKELRLTTRTGLPIMTLKNEPSLNKMNCLLNLDDTSLLVGCQNNRITAVDLSQGQITGETPTSNGVCLLKLSEQYICCGDVAGQVFMMDPVSLQTMPAFPAHMAGMCDMDVVGNYLVTCGLVQRYGQLCVDTQLKVFDLRFLRPMSPCDVTMLQPFLIRCIPAVESTVLVLSQMGEFQLLDLRGLVTPSSMVLNHLNTSAEGVMACAVDVGPSCQCLAFGDSSGMVHLWSDQEEVVMNPYATQETIFPDPVEESLPFISWDNDDPNSAPLSAVPMALSSHGQGPLFSHWPDHCSKFTRRMVPPIDPEVLDNIRMSHFVGYAPKPAHILRNQVPYDLDREMKNHIPESPMMRENNPLSLVPKPYRQVEIKYSKLGIETFDFGHYNETKFAGLEIHIPNAYCNSMLQVLYFLEPIQCAIQKHLCPKEFCLACELGLLFRMLDRSEGQSCQANNFLRAFRTLREAAGLGLLLSWENEEQKINLGKLIQNWTRFVLQQLNQETDPCNLAPPTSSTTAAATPSTPLLKTFPPATPTTPLLQLGIGSFLNPEEEGIGYGGEDRKESKSVIQELFGSSVETLVKCRCGWSTMTQRVELLFSLSYPHNNLAPHQFNMREKKLPHEKTSFSSILQQSICRQQRMTSWCENCGKYKLTTHQKALCDLPKVLVLNCQVESEEDKEFWQIQQQKQQLKEGTPPPPMNASGLVRWVPLTIKLSIHKGNVLKVSQHTSNGQCEETKKEERSSISSISSDKTIKEHEDGVSFSESGDHVDEYESSEDTTRKSSVERSGVMSEVGGNGAGLVADEKGSDNNDGVTSEGGVGGGEGGGGVTSEEEKVKESGVVGKEIRRQEQEREIGEKADKLEVDERLELRDEAERMNTSMTGVLNDIAQQLGSINEELQESTEKVAIEEEPEHHPNKEELLSIPDSTMQVKSADQVSIDKNPQDNDNMKERPNKPVVIEEESVKPEEKPQDIDEQVYMKDEPHQDIAEQIDIKEEPQGSTEHVKIEEELHCIPENAGMECNSSSRLESHESDSSQGVIVMGHSVPAGEVLEQGCVPLIEEKIQIRGEVELSSMEGKQKEEEERKIKEQKMEVEVGSAELGNQDVIGKEQADKREEKIPDEVEEEVMDKGGEDVDEGGEEVIEEEMPDKGEEEVLDKEEEEERDEREGEGSCDEAESCAEYELSMIVSHVREPWMETAGNLVAHIKVGPTYHHRKKGKEETQWYLFNDFHITPMKESEIGVFPMEWLTPAVLVYTQKDYAKSFNTDVSVQLDPIVLLTETHSPRPAQSPATFTPLAFPELPNVGDLVGIDAEFVTLNQEEAEVKSDGTHTTLKPIQFSVARITVIRGGGPMEGSPFIDDYISTSEQVVDYLTKFSGIKPGDLDASMSSKHLTTLKASYLKLLYLLENGVKFVGHGLNKDFRVINILIPPEQIIDTVKLFHLPNQRYVSLKYLAWFFLKKHIQKGVHDSCEDARTALALYRKYQELEKSGLVAEMLKKLYETGRSVNWQVPDS